MKVLYLPEVEDYLVDLIEILYHKEYFGMYEDARDYVLDLIQFIEVSIEKTPCKKAPSHFSIYGKGMSYILYKRNASTQWYVFFTKDEYNNYLIRFIGNNHTIAQYL